MNILILLDSLNCGGVETREFDFVKQFINNRHKIIIAAPKGKFLKNYLDAGVKYFEMDFDFTNFVGTFNKVKSIILNESIDLIALHHYQSILLGAVSAILLNKPFVVTIHSVGDFNLYTEVPFYDDLLLSLVFPNVAVVIAISEEVQNFLISKFKINKDNILIIRNCVDTNLFKSFNKSDKQDKFLLVSRLSEEKRKHIYETINLFLEIRKNNSKALLDIAGSGNIESDLEKYIYKINEKIGMRAINLLGEQNEIYKNMHNSDVVLGMGRVILEAISCKRKAVLIGYDGVKGVLKKSKMNYFLKTNFSGRDCENQSYEKVIFELENTDKKDVLEIYDLICNDFSLLNNFTKLEAAYFDAINKEKNYNNSSYIVFILERALELKIKNKTIKEMKLSLADKSKIIFEQRKYIQDIFNTTSWKSTRFLRWIKDKFFK